MLFGSYHWLGIINLPYSKVFDNFFGTLLLHIWNIQSSHVQGKDKDTTGNHTIEISMMWKSERVCLLCLVRSKKNSVSVNLSDTTPTAWRVGLKVQCRCLGWGTCILPTHRTSIGEWKTVSSVNSIAGKLPHPVCQVTHARVRMGFLGNSIGIEGREQWVSEMCNKNVEISS